MGVKVKREKRSDTMIGFLSFTVIVLKLSSACELIPQNREVLDKKVVRLFDTRYGDGVNADDGGTVVHGRCTTDVPSPCNWVFTRCGSSSCFNGSDYYAIESEYYPSSFMYADTAHQVTRQDNSISQVCSNSNSYKWFVFYASCTDRWYLFNYGTTDWLDASTLKQVYHNPCNVADPFDTDSNCGEWRRFYFYNIHDYEN